MNRARTQKAESVAAIKNILADSTMFLVVHYRGMTDNEIYQMRTILKSNGCNIKVAKNTLVKIAMKDSGANDMINYMSGPTAIVYSKDPVAVSKVISDISKTVESLKVVAGYFGGKVLNQTSIADLAKLGSISQVRSQFLTTLNKPTTSIVSTFQMVRMLPLLLIKNKK